MPNRIVINPSAPQNLKTQIYGSDLTQPLQVEGGALSVTGTLGIDATTTISVTVANELTIASLPEVTVANELTITSLPEVTVASMPEVTVANELTIASLPEVTVANELTIASLPEVTVASMPEVTVANELTIASMPEVTVANELTIASLPEVTVASMPEVTVANELTIASLPEVTVASMPEVTVANELTIASLPEVTVASMPEVTVANELTIASLPEVTVASMPEVTVANELTIASLPEVTVANELTIASLPEVTVANELTIASIPEVTVANELTIASMPEVTVANELTIASLPEVTVASMPEVTVANELTIASLPEVTVANELTIASLPEVTVASMPEVTVANELTIASIPEVTVANELTIASLPEVTVASMPEITVANELTIASLPEVTVANELTIASLPEVTVANELTIASIPEVTVANELTIASLPEVTVANELTIASLPEVTVANELTIVSLPEVTVANELTIVSLPEVTVANELTIVSLPEVTVANELTIASLPEVTVANELTIVSLPEVTTILSARANINESTNLIYTSAQVTTPTYDVSALSDFSYVFLSSVPATGYIYISPTLSPLISITYSIDKMGDGKAQALNNWLKEFIFTVLIQPFHCAIYMCMTGTALDILVTKSGGGVSDDTLAASIVAILCIKFIKDAEKLVKKIFAFKSDDSKTSMAAGLAVSAMALSNAKGLGASGRRFIGGAVNLAKNTGKIARDVAVDTMAMGALLASKDKDKTFAETKEEMGAKWDNWRADRIEKKNQKYTTNRSLRAAVAMKKANKNLKYLGKDGAMAKADAAFEKEKEAKVEARTKEKIAQSGGTMSEDAARAAARKEIAKETRTANSPVRRSIKKASGWVDTAKKNIASSAVLRELGGIAKSKVATSFGIVAGAGLYGSNGNLATAITTGAAVGTSMNEFMKSTKGTVVNQSSSLVKDFNGTNANPNELRKDLNKIFETESEKYDGSSDTLKEMDRLLSDLDNLIGSSAADGYRTDMKNVIENNAELANDGVDAIFDRIEKNNPDIANNESYKKMKKDTLHHADGVALYANMKKVGETGISTQDYTEMLVTEVFPDDADRATYASTRDVNTTEQDKHIQILDGEQDAIDNEVSTMGDAELERFCESVDNEFETQMLVMESLDNSDPVRENYKNYIKEMKKKRDDAIIALYAKGNRDLETVSEQFAERAKEIIAQRHEELLKEAQDNNPTIRQNAQVRLEKSNKAMTNLNISLNNNTNTEAES